MSGIMLSVVGGGSKPVTGQQEYTTAGTYSWVVPAGVTSISVVAVGAGSNRGGGGALRYVNNISVTPGESLSVRVDSGGAAYPNSSYLKRSSTVLVEAAGGNYYNGGTTGTGTGGNGGTSGGRGGAGAGGYSGNGGNGGNSPTAPQNGAGGGGGGGGQGGNSCSYFYGSGGGGGVGILGAGSNGTAGTNSSTLAGSGGGGGSGGGSGGAGSYYTFVCACTGTQYLPVGGDGGTYGGGGGNGDSPANGGGGALRIIWPGTTRSFPSTNTGNL